MINEQTALRVSLLYLGYGAAGGGHLSGRQDVRSVRIRYDPPKVSATITDTLYTEFENRLCSASLLW